MRSYEVILRFILPVPSCIPIQAPVSIRRDTRRLDIPGIDHPFSHYELRLFNEWRLWLLRDEALPRSSSQDVFIRCVSLCAFFAVETAAFTAPVTSGQ